MTTINRSAVIDYSAQQMFDLVNRVEEYPEFLPWCSECVVLEKKDNEITAKVVIAWKGISKQFTTQNTLKPYHEIDMKLVSGPFRQFDGKWLFEALGEQQCKVSLNLAFELSGGFLDRMFEPFFNSMANNFVDVFCQRAAVVYG